MNLQCTTTSELVFEKFYRFVDNIFIANAAQEIFLKVMSPLDLSFTPTIELILGTNCSNLLTNIQNICIANATLSEFSHVRYFIQRLENWLFGNCTSLLTKTPIFWSPTLQNGFSPIFFFQNLQRLHSPPPKNGKVTSHIWMRHITEWVMSRILANEPFLIYKCVKS